VRSISRLEEIQRDHMSLIVSLSEREMQSIIAINAAVAQGLEIFKSGQGEIDKIRERY
jgi:hypothetical protein